MTVFDEDVLQDILSSLGPFRLESIVRQGLYTTSMKAIDLSTNIPYLFKLHKASCTTRAPAAKFADVPSVGGWLERRRWVSRCLKDRLTQFPYVTGAEGRLIMSYLQLMQPERPVKLSNILLTHWNRVFIVDEIVANGCCYNTIDDSADPLAPGQIKEVLGVDGPLLSASFSLFASLSLNSDAGEGQFEEAALLTCSQIEECIDDVQHYSDLPELLLAVLLQIVKVSTVSTTRSHSLSLVHQLVKSVGSGDFVQLSVVPCLADCLASSNGDNGIIKMLALHTISLIDSTICGIKKVPKIRQLIDSSSGNFNLLAVYGELFRDVSVFYHLVDGGAVALAGRVARALGSEEIRVHCVPRLIDYTRSAQGDDLLTALDGLALLSAKVLDASQVGELIIPVLREHSFPSSPMTILASSGILPDCFKGIKTSSARASCREWRPKVVEQIMEEEDEEEPGSGSGYKLLTRENVLSSKELSAARFWRPAAGKQPVCSVPFRDVLRVLQFSKWIVHVTKTDVRLYPHSHYPYCEAVKTIDHGGERFITCSPDLAFGIIGIVLRDGERISCRLYDLRAPSMHCIYQLSLPEEPFHTSLVTVDDNSCLLMISKANVRLFRLLQSTFDVVYTVQLPFAATSAAISPFSSSFAVIGTHPAHIVLFDVRAGCVSAVHKLPMAAVAGCMLSLEWNDMAEHRRGRAWVSSGADDALLVDLVSGECLKERSLLGDDGIRGSDRSSGWLLGCVGAHFVVTASKAAVTFWEWRTKRKQTFSLAGMAEDVEECAFIGGTNHKSIVVVEPSKLHYIS